MKSGGSDSASTSTRRGLRRCGAALAVLLACADICAAAPAAQAKPRPRGSRSSAPASQADVFGGYSFTRAGSAKLNGGHVSVSLPFWREVNVVGDLSLHRGSFAGADLSRYSLLVGGRRYWRSGSFRPFAEVLGGAVRSRASFVTPDAEVSSSSTDLALAPGGGVDYRLSEGWSARAVVDLVFVHGGGWDKDPRLSLGVVYRFGGR